MMDYCQETVGKSPTWLNMVLKAGPDSAKSQKFIFSRFQG